MLQTSESDDWAPGESKAADEVRDGDADLLFKDLRLCNSCPTLGQPKPAQCTSSCPGLIKMSRN